MDNGSKKYKTEYLPDLEKERKIKIMKKIWLKHKKKHEQGVLFAEQKNIKNS